MLSLKAHLQMNSVQSKILLIISELLTDFNIFRTFLILSLIFNSLILKKIALMLFVQKKMLHIYSFESYDYSF